MLTIYDVIDIFPIFDRFGAIWKPDSECVVCKTYISINSNLLSYKNKTEKSLKQFSDFLQKNADISKIKEVLVLNFFFFMKLHMCVYLRSKFQASSIILTSFRQGGAILSSHRQTRLKNPPRLGLQQIKWFHFCRLHTFVQSISGQCTHFIPQGFLLLSGCIIYYPKMG